MSSIDMLPPNEPSDPPASPKPDNPPNSPRSVKSYTPKTTPRHKNPQNQTVSPFSRPPIHGQRFGFTLPPGAMPVDNQKKFDFDDSSNSPSKFTTSSKSPSRLTNFSRSLSRINNRNSYGNTNNLSNFSYFSIDNISRISSNNQNLSGSRKREFIDPETIRGSSTFVSVHRREPAALERKIVDQINLIRSNHGLNLLIFSRHLSDIEAAHNTKMAQGKIPLSNDGLKGRVRQIDGIAGFHECVGSCVSSCPDPAGKLVDMWMESSAHRKGILGHFTKIGIAIERSRVGPQHRRKRIGVDIESNHLETDGEDDVVKGDWFATIMFALM
ncbi:hypothetical protein TRFO_35025 [Tritrichomonas foetus]|uniref:SCP domain-containing protein n=1 Tax=Tritrichomonas foetus TaxID=1144522 RepID=A0A1J4JHH7_9EUKA|nr:hypothetical protein TRFO_35025 [Tritrichomonas foetus]|eukprot:OHS98590.1 hypothetical protein TRFO_35025 [Tritrichomonas foetus]